MGRICIRSSPRHSASQLIQWGTISVLVIVVIVVVLCKLLSVQKAVSSEVVYLNELPTCMDKQKEIMSLIGRVEDKTKTANKDISTVPLHYVNGVFGCLYIDLRINDSPTIFFVDTGYAGPPVINPWHQAREETVIETIGEANWEAMSLADRLKECNNVPESYQSAGTGQSQFINRHMCSTYASTCTMRLAGIASNMERVTDMVLCPELVPGTLESSKTRGNHPEADLLVTMTMRGVTHVLTLDYLQSHHNFRIDIQNKQNAQLTLGQTISPPEGWIMLHTKRIHGVFAIRINLSIQIEADIYNSVGWFTLDSGSSAPLVLNKSFFEKLVQYSAPAADVRFVQQSGINNETTCAQVLQDALIQVQDATNALYTIDVISPVLCNDTNTMGVDGYAGLELIAAWKGMFANDKEVWIPGSSNKITIPSTFFNRVESDYC